MRIGMGALALALTLGAAAQESDLAREVRALRAQLEAQARKIAALEKALRRLEAFNERLCKKLREENIIIFPSEPKTLADRIRRQITMLKAAVDKMNEAMASRNPFGHEKANRMKEEAEKALKAFPKEKVIPLLKAEVEASMDNFMRCSALMGTLGTVGGNDVMPYLQSLVEDRKRPGFVRRVAAEVMLNVNKDRAIDILVPVAGDTNQQWPERFFVIYLLSETKDPRVLPMLIRGAKTDPDKSSRCHHINGLAHYKTPDARATLEWVIAHDDYEHARTNALASLHRMLGDEAAYLVMKRYLNAKKPDGTPDYPVRNQAFQIMNRIRLKLEREGKPIPGEKPKEKGGTKKEKPKGEKPKGGQPAPKKKS